MAGNTYIGNTRIKKIYYVDSSGNLSQIKRGYVGTSSIYSAGNIVTYVVDTNNTKTEEVDMGASCLNPKTFTPSKSGWTFVGWREDKTASSSVLPSKVMGDNPVTLYAVFKVDVTISKYDGANTITNDKKSRYYNNGNYNNPSFTLSQKTVSGWAKAGWTTSSSGYSATISDGGTISNVTNNATYYSLYSQAVTLTLYNGSTTATTTTKQRVANYHNVTTFSNPSFTLTENKVSGWSAAGWTTLPTGYFATVANGGNTGELIADATFYSLYTAPVSVNWYNNSTNVSKETKYRVINYHNTTSVNEPVFSREVANASGWTVRGWSTSNSAISSIDIPYASGQSFSRSSDLTLYSAYYKSCYVTYNGNGNTSGSMSKSMGYAYRNAFGTVTPANITLSGNGFARSGWTFKGWAMDPIDYVGDLTSIRTEWDTTVYAVWKIDSISLATIAPSVNNWTSTCTNGSIQNSDGANDYTFKRVANGQTGSATFKLGNNSYHCEHLKIVVSGVQIPDSGTITISCGTDSVVLNKNSAPGEYLLINSLIAAPRYNEIVITTSNSSNDYVLYINRARSMFY